MLFAWLRRRLKANTRNGPTGRLTVVEASKKNKLDPSLPDKLQLFSWWAEDHFGKVEGARLLRAVLHAERLERAIQQHGDFVQARQSLLDIAMLFPEAAQMPAFPAEPDLQNESTRQWRELMRRRYGQ